MATISHTAEWQLMTKAIRDGDNMQLDWVPGAALGIAGAALAWWRAAGISEAKFQERLEQIRKEMEKGAQINDKSDKEFKEDLCAAINELRAVTLTIAKMSSGQDVLNAVTTKAIESLTVKAEFHSRAIHELQATTGLIREWLERSNKS
jgi:hypothetical protein